MARKAYIRLSAEVTEGDSATVFKSMRHTLKAEKVEMETVSKEGNGPHKCKVTGYFWADVIVDMEEVPADAQGDS